MDITQHIFFANKQVHKNDIKWVVSWSKPSCDFQMVRNNARLNLCAIIASVCVFLFYLSPKIVEMMTEPTMNVVSDGVPLKLDDHQSCSERQKDATSRISQYCQSISKKRTEVSYIFLLIQNTDKLIPELLVTNCTFYHYRRVG